MLEIAGTYQYWTVRPSVEKVSYKLSPIFTPERGQSCTQIFQQIFVFDCPKQRFRLQKSILWQSKTSNLRSAMAKMAIENSLFGSRERLTFK